MTRRIFAVLIASIPLFFIGSGAAFAQECSYSGFGYTDTKGTCRMTCGDDEVSIDKIEGYQDPATPLCPGFEICCVPRPKPATTATTTGVAAPAAPASAGSPVTLTNPLGSGTTLYTLVQRVIQAFLGVVGAAALLVFVYAGILWMTGGTSERIQTAKDAMKYAVIGLAMIAFAYGISVFLVDALIGNVTTQSTEPQIEYATPPPPNP